MGLASARSLRTSVKISMSTSVQHHAGHQRDTAQPPPDLYLHKDRGPRETDQNISHSNHFLGTHSVRGTVLCSLDVLN